MIIKELKCCLIVSETKDFQETLTSLLKTKLNLNNVSTTLDFMDAKKKLKSQKFNLVIADFETLGKTRIELLRDILEVKSMDASKILLLSNQLVDDQAINAIKLGIRNILVKPFDTNKFLQSVESMVGPNLN